MSHAARNAIDAVIFDCDGVLVDSETINNVIFAALVTEAGVPTTFSDSVRRYMGRSTRECIAEVESQLRGPIPFDLARAYRIRTQQQHKRLRAVRGALPLLRWLTQRGTPMCVASSATPPEITHRLHTAGLLPFFRNRCYSATMVAAGKPAPDLFLLAAERLGVLPGRCLVVEDSPPGVRAGRAARMTVAGYAALATPERLAEAGTDYVVSRLSDLRAVIAGCDTPPRPDKASQRP